MKKSLPLFLGLLLSSLSGARAALHKSQQDFRRPALFGLGNDVDRRFATLPSTSMSRLHHDRNSQSIVVRVRGGECSDSTPELFAKVGLGAAVDTTLMYALVNFAAQANTLEYSKGIIRSIQAIVLLAIIFGSASFGSIVDMGLSAATKQVLDPNQIPVSPHQCQQLVVNSVVMSHFYICIH